MLQRNALAGLSQGLGWNWGLGKVPSCSNGARATRRAGRGCVAFWSRCRGRPQSRREQWESTQCWRECSGHRCGTWVGPAAAATPSLPSFLLLRPPDQPCLSAEPLSAASRPPRLKLPCPAGELANWRGLRHCPSPNWLRGLARTVARPRGKKHLGQENRGYRFQVWGGGFLEQPLP